MATNLTWFNVVIALLMMVLGFLLNRVFNELDRLRDADTKLAAQVNVLSVNLPSSYITKDDFRSHEAEERVLIGEFRKEVRENLDRIHERLDMFGNKGPMGE